jgi:hypothetical protein
MLINVGSSKEAPQSNAIRPSPRPRLFLLGTFFLGIPVSGFPPSGKCFPRVFIPRRIYPGAILAWDFTVTCKTGFVLFRAKKIRARTTSANFGANTVRACHPMYEVLYQVTTLILEGIHITVTFLTGVVNVTPIGLWAYFR